MMAQLLTSSGERDERGKTTHGEKRKIRNYLQIFVRLLDLSFIQTISEILLEDFVCEMEGRN